MTSGKRINLAASVRQRLLNVARLRREELQYVLTRYGLERLLYRLSCSPHARGFVLKGATLFQLWTDQPHRPTRDLDLLCYGDAVPQRFTAIFREVCAAEVEDDGLRFDPASIVVDHIKEEDEYQGLRVRITAWLETARIPLQLDIGFGDAITPEAEEVTYPTLLGFTSPKIQAYPRETVIAEKFQAMVMLGIANSRMKDFYDLWTLARQFDFNGSTVSQAIAATFARRQTALPSSAPLALTDQFASDPRKQSQWRGFLGKGRLVDPTLELGAVIRVLADFLLPPALAAGAPQHFSSIWRAGGPWISHA